MEFEITEEQWPTKHLPEIIIAEFVGEVEGYSVENLINNLIKYKIENTTAYRGDLKGELLSANFVRLTAR